MSSPTPLVKSATSGLSGKSDGMPTTQSAPSTAPGIEERPPITAMAMIDSDDSESVTLKRSGAKSTSSPASRPPASAGETAGDDERSELRPHGGERERGRRLLVVAHRDERAPDPTPADLDDEVHGDGQHQQADEVVGALRGEVDAEDARRGAPATESPSGNRNGRRKSHDDAAMPNASVATARNRPGAATRALR